MPGTTVDRVRMGSSASSYVASLDGALRAAGLWDGEIWKLMGLTGIGFHFIVHEGTCPSSPTAYDWTVVHTQAAERLGLRTSCAEYIHDYYSPQGPDWQEFAEHQSRAVEMIRDCLDRGVPAVVWAPTFMEFGILAGYDEGDGVFFVCDAAVGSDADPLLFSNLGRNHGFPFLFAQVFGPGDGFDLPGACRQSLEYAVGCWKGTSFEKSPVYDYPVGAAGYRTLIAALELEDSDPLGLRYILRVQADARDCIAKYLTWIAAEGILPGLDGAAEMYRQAAPALQKASNLLPAMAPFERPLEKEAVPEASALLRRCAELEQDAMSTIEAALA